MLPPPLIDEWNALSTNLLIAVKNGCELSRRYKRKARQRAGENREPMCEYHLQYMYVLGSEDF